MEDKLKKYRLKLHESDSPDRYEVDFNIEDSSDNVAWVWGHGLNDVEFECNHPYECVEFGDGTEQGQCALCGSYCDYHFEEDDFGHNVPQPHDWYPRREAGGLIGEYLEELRNKNA